MFEKFSEVAEKVAVSVSRRQFLGRFGGGALALAAAVGGFLALSGDAKAGPPGACGPGSEPACFGFADGERGGCEFGVCKKKGKGNDCFCFAPGPGPRGG